MATKFKYQDKVRLTNYIEGYGPDKVWTVIHTLQEFGTTTKVQVTGNGILRKFSEANLELVSQRVEGKKIDPRDVKIGDVILTTYTTTAGNVFTRKGRVDEKRPLLGGGHILTANGQDIYHDNWVQIKEGPTVELVKAAPEPHALEKAKPGDWFALKREIKFSEPGSVRYTNVRDSVWLEEQFSALGRREMSYVLPESDVRSVFDGHKAKLVTV